jgi:flavodoxin/NAD-dependent dihydropyrimidine dehydrogenase PreA subunit
MEVNFIYFSQTGNTRQVARVMADSFREGGHAARMMSLHEANPEDAVWGDLLGVGTPTFSSKAPQPVMRFLDALPPLKGKKAFVYATCGGAPGRVLFDMANSLRKKGACVIGGFLTLGEVHHPAPSLYGRFPGRPDEEDFSRARRFAKSVAESASGKCANPGHEPNSKYLVRGWRFYELLGLIISERTIRAFMPEPKVDLPKCDRCGWCLEECPMDNIVLKPYPVLGKSCIRCYRCYTGCPQKAFTADWRLANIYVGSLYNTAFIQWFGDVKPGGRIY